MNINTSNDINVLSVKVTFDLSGTLPAVSLVNLSAGDDLASCTWWYKIISPSGTIIHEGTESTPDITGNWTTDVDTSAWPRPFNQVEWSGANYSFQIWVKDGDGNIFYDTPQTANICRPYGNTPTSKNTYGLAASNVSVKCSEGRVFFQDTTYHSYKGSEGEQIASTLRVIYPIDETLVIPDPFAIADYTTALVPISYSSSNYQFLQFTIYGYDLGNNVFVRIKYQTIQTFAVWCNVDLEPLVCEINKLMDEVNNGSCLDVSEANKKLLLITPKLFLAFMGIMQPLTGIDVPTVIEEIKTIGGFDCNCCSAATGIIPTTSSIIDGYNFAINPVCGDINGTITVNGYNITFNLQDKSYVFEIFDESPTDITAFEIIEETNGCQKTYKLKTSGTQLAEDILNIIANDISLVNLFNTIVNNATNGNNNLIVDGKCIFNTANSCDYTFTILNVPQNTTYALLTTVNGNAVNFAFNETNLPALQAYLNGLGYGTFVVTNPNPNEVLFTSTGNTNNINYISYSVASTAYIADMTKNCTGYTPLTANQVVQNIINYLCPFADTKIETSQDYEICYIDPIVKIKKTVTISSGAALTDFIIELLARGCDTIDYVINLSSNTCNGIKNLFPQNINTLQPTDYILGTKEGDCARMLPVEFGTKMLEFGIYDVDFMTALCVAVAQCGAGSICAPFNYFYLVADYGSPSDDTMNIVVYFNQTGASQVSIRYARIDNTNNPTYITLPNVPIGSSPQIINVADGQYTVGIKAVYADGRLCSEITQATEACAGITAFSATFSGSPSDSFLISYNASGSLPQIRVNISYPNGGSWSQIYTNDGNDITIPFPDSVYGDFAITLSPVCNEDTGFIGAATAPVILTVTNPDADTSNAWTISYTNTGSGADPVILSLGNNGANPASITLYSGNYTSNPLTGTNAALPATNANVLFQVGGGKTILSITCNGIAGTTGGSTSAWGGINGSILINFITN